MFVIADKPIMVCAILALAAREHLLPPHDPGVVIKAVNHFLQLPPHDPGVVIKAVNHFLQDDREAAMMVDTADRYGSDTKHQSSGDVPQEEKVAEITNLFNRERSFMELVEKLDGTGVKFAKF
ncbi:hypothetical protein POM88_002549 [Heracleum sosnowskyi]|uniref:Uncharacterized protein n=1 Tax=Heracleum sosnowskyi TaxID=360622 RepID=A0AAD8JGB2_9APIA|nr:hypothetical protein POM88_002549 [Heracleum sosnowskyi]